MTKKQVAIKIFEELENNHINLYHDISKKDFQKKLNEFLLIANDLDDIHFDAEMLKLFALFKDAHTMYFVDEHYVDKCIKFINGKFYFYDKDMQICDEIVAVNGHGIDEVVKKLGETIGYEVEPWLNFLTEYRLRGLMHMQMIDCANLEDSNQIEYTLRSGDKIKKRAQEMVSTNNYSFSTHDDVLIVDYKVCRDMKNYPFVQFVENIKRSFKNQPKACLIDLRYNKGGNNRLIYPLIEWLKNNDVKTYALMNGGVFSSGVWALIDLKHELNATLIGTDAGQAAHCYGECKEIEVQGKSFTYCKKYFNRSTIDTKQSVSEYPMSKVIDYDGPIRPDIYLEPRFEDLKLGIDSQLRGSLKIIKNDLEHQDDLESRRC